MYLFNIKKIKANDLVTLLLLFLVTFYILNSKIDKRYYETKLVVDKINLLKQKKIVVNLIIFLMNMKCGL
jgi:hypothetical protein